MSEPEAKAVEAPANGAPSSDARAPLPPPSAKRALLVALGTTAVVTLVSLFAPERFAATAVGCTFLASTYWFVLRRDEGTIRAHGLSMGGLLEPRALDMKRLSRDAFTALGWALLLALIFFPPFYFGYKLYWHARPHFVLRLPKSVIDEIAGQVVVIALPEESFFRGYLQSELDRAWGTKLRILGADVGPGLVVSAAIFAVGHVLTIRHPARLAVFFPALIFGWLRARTKGVGAGVAFHAMCNIWSATLARGFGLGG